MAKYNNKKSLSLHNDDNEYCIGFCGNGDTKRCDFYVNKELMFQGIPFRKGNSVKVLKSGYFINVKDSQGINRVIRDGKVVFSTHRHVVNAYAHLDYDADGIEFISKTYLIIVSRNGLFGICSSKGHLILPIKYSTIDIDESFNIVIGEKIDLDMYVGELKEVMLESMRRGEYMQIGKYIKKYDTIECEAARVFGEEVEVVKDWQIHYIWNDGFSDFEIVEDDCYGVNVPSNWDDYSHEDSLYDALGGEMDASWNID